MINIIGNKDNTIFYECSCGVKGRCIFKPLSEDGTLLINLKCVACNETKRVFINQYRSNLYFDKLADGEDLKISWSLVLDNKLVEE